MHHRASFTTIKSSQTTFLKLRGLPCLQAGGLRGLRQVWLEEVQQRVGNRHSGEGRRGGAEDSAKIDWHHRDHGKVQHQHRGGGRRSGIIHLTHARRIRYLDVDRGRVATILTVAQKIRVDVLSRGANGSIVIVVATVGVRQSILGHGVRIAVRGVVVGNGGTVSRQRDRETLLQNDLLRCVLVSIVRDIAVVGGITRVTVVSADVVGGLVAVTVGVPVLVQSTGTVQA
mmetsp:Transcript_6727/g.11334  ORF Transcript_6727/g.11334 Transcript_6727/m.11334 type:complete len:229 (-) Transcript_6727:348-1034(-)